LFSCAKAQCVFYLTKDRYSEGDFTIFYDLIFEINTRNDWIVEGPHVLRVIKVICRTNVRLALCENVIQWSFVRPSFFSCKFLVTGIIGHQDAAASSASAIGKLLVSLLCNMEIYLCEILICIEKMLFD